MKTVNAVIENAVPGYTAEAATRAAQTLAAFAQTARTWSFRARTRRALRGLTPRMLDDVGIEPGEARYEASKPFWRA